jgi:hypothetical protein
MRLRTELTETGTFDAWDCIQTSEEVLQCCQIAVYSFILLKYNRGGIANIFIGPLIVNPFFKLLTANLLIFKISHSANRQCDQNL